MNDNNQQLLREKLNHAPVDRCLLTEKLAYLDYVRRITSFDQEEDAFVIEMPPRNLSILPFVVKRLVSIHFRSGDTVMGTVQRIDEDGDDYDSGMFTFGGLCKPRASIFLRNAWLLEIHTEQAQRRYLQDTERDLVLNRICQDATFKTFLGTLQQWWKGCHLDPMDGYPNKFNLFLMAIFFLQCFEGVPLWSELAAADFVPFLCTSHTANDVFYSFLHFLVHHSCRYKIDLHVGQCKEKRPGGSLRTWLLRDQCNYRNRNVFEGIHPDKVREVLEMHVLPTLNSCPSHELICK